MVGKKNGLAALLKEDVPPLVSVHCICHKLVLECVDTNKDLKIIKKGDSVVEGFRKLS